MSKRFSTRKVAEPSENTGSLSTSCRLRLSANGLLVARVVSVNNGGDGVVVARTLSDETLTSNDDDGALGVGVNVPTRTDERVDELDELTNSGQPTQNVSSSFVCDLKV